MELKAVAGGRLERLAYSPAEVAAACGLSRKAIYRAIDNGELRAAKVCRGRRLLITAEELRAWIERMRTAAASEREAALLSVLGYAGLRLERQCVREVAAPAVRRSPQGGRSPQRPAVRPPPLVRVATAARGT